MAFWDYYEDCELDDDMWPTQAAPEYRLVAHPPENGNRGGFNDTYDAAQPYIALKNAEAIHFSLNREVLSSNVVSPTAHDHHTHERLLRWIPLCAVSFTNGLGGTAGAPNRHNGKVLTTGTTAKRLTTIPVHLPQLIITEKRLRLFPRIRVSPYSLAADKLPLRCIIGINDAMGTNDYMAIATPQTLCVEQNNTFNSDKWFCGEPMELTTALSVVNNSATIYVTLDIYVDAASGMYLREFQLMLKEGIG